MVDSELWVDDDDDDDESWHTLIGNHHHTKNSSIKIHGSEARDRLATRRY